VSPSICHAQITTKLNLQMTSLQEVPDGLAEPVLRVDKLWNICNVKLDLLHLENIESLDEMLASLELKIQERLAALADDNIYSQSAESISKRKSELFALWVEEANDFVDRFKEMALLFGVETLSHRDESIFVLWKILHFAGELIPNIKYSVNVAFCRHFGDLEMPEKIQFDLGLNLFPKSFRVALGRLRSKERRLKKTSLYLINSLFQGWKKGLLPLDIIAYDRNLVKHRVNLCEKSGDIETSLGDDVYRITSDVMSGFFPEQYESDSLVPSTSATIESRSAHGGSFGYLMEILNEYETLRPSKTCKGYSEGHVRDIDYSLIDPENFLGYLRCGLKVWEVRGRGPTLSEVKQLERSMWLESLFDPFQVSPFGILEPLKIRTITRPSVRTHFGLRRVQKDLLQHLNRFRAFQITGDSNKEHLADHLSGLFQNDRLDAMGFNHFVSGDYSSATDLLKSDVTKIIWEVIGLKLPWWVYEKGLRSLCGTTIRYAQENFPRITGPYDWYEPCSSVGDSQQTNGQLMGNILSFPILCIANYCSWHIAMERFLGKKCSFQYLSEFAVSINGDDILFRSDEKFYELWSKTISEFGFVKSLGKNMFSTEMFQINSQLFKVEGLIFPSGCQKIGYFNFGLLTGRKKGMDSNGFLVRYDRDFNQTIQKRSRDELVRDLTAVNTNFSILLKDLPVSLKEKVKVLQKKWFLRRFKELITLDQWKAISLPESLGGLGFSEDISVKKFDSFDQVKSCFSLRHHDSEAAVYFPRDYAYGKMQSEALVSVNHPKRNCFDVVLQKSRNVIAGYTPRILYSLTL
jgi:hypothetical protein